MVKDSVELRLRIYLILFVTAVAVGIVGFSTVENLSLSKALYFTIVTVATVGYGDIHPSTTAGRVMAMVLIVMGVGTFLGMVATATEMFLNRREKTVRVQKLQMVVGLFFSEVGARLLRSFVDSDPHCDAATGTLKVDGTWTDRDFESARSRSADFECDVSIGAMNLEHLREFLRERSDLLIRLLESPYLLEHETLTDLLLATLHLKEELVVRETLSDLPETDLVHLGQDVRRAYRLLTVQWLDYMKHLKSHYPYLFSLAVRTNPFNRDATPVVA